MPGHSSGRFSNPDNRIEFATNDQDLINRLASSCWLQGRKYRSGAMDQLREKATPVTAYERRYTRNKAVIKQIYAELRSQEPERVKPYKLLPAVPNERPAAAAADDDDDEVVVLSSRPIASSRTPHTVPTPARASGRHISTSTARANEGAAALVALSVDATQREASEDGEIANQTTDLISYQRNGPVNSSRLPTPAYGPVAVTDLPPDQHHRRVKSAALQAPSYGPATATHLPIDQWVKPVKRLALSSPSYGPVTVTALPTDQHNKLPDDLAPSTTPRKLNSLPPVLRRSPRKKSKSSQLNPHAATYVIRANAVGVAGSEIGALKPLQDRIEEDNQAIVRLRQRNTELEISLQRQSTALTLLKPTDAGERDTIERLEREKAALARALEGEIWIKQEAVGALRSMQKINAVHPYDDPRGIKRKAPRESPMRMGDETNGNDEHDTSGHLHHLANKIVKDLDQVVANEKIQLCGLAPLRIIASHPEEVLALAYDKLNAYRFAVVPTQWRRLYEDASLHKAVEMLRTQALTANTFGGRVGKRRKVQAGLPTDEWVSEVITVLDKAVSMSGAPGRKPVFDAVFQQLENLVDNSHDAAVPQTFRIHRPKTLESEYPISRVMEPMGFEDFQGWLNDARRPLIIHGTMSEWPATQKWHGPSYLHGLTLGGRRLVPVEIGKSYADEGWGQRIMTFGQFMREYLLPDNPAEVGYLAQHDLFAQIPALKNDVMVPDYCYTTPPKADGAALKTAGLAAVKPLDEPLLNAWLGPKGTKTPLHTDPYHNILCQVVGYKYVRLYPPSETPKLYPSGIDEAGVSMDNTSQVDVSHARPRSLGGSTDLDAVREMEQKFPLFREAEYQEAILGPGECLYIPLGWWHYVEGLSTSFSVSFWWN